MCELSGSSSKLPRLCGFIINQSVRVHYLLVSTAGEGRGVVRAEAGVRLQLHPKGHLGSSRGCLPLRPQSWPVCAPPCPNQPPARPLGDLEGNWEMGRSPPCRCPGTLVGRRRKVIYGGLGVGSLNLRPSRQGHLLSSPSPWGLQRD